MRVLHFRCSASGGARSMKVMKLMKVMKVIKIMKLIKIMTNFYF